LNYKTAQIKLRDAYADRAVIETLQGNKREALQDFDKAFKLDPTLRSTSKTFIEKRLSVVAP
jgi:hypothetical protein